MNRRLIHCFLLYLISGIAIAQPEEYNINRISDSIFRYQGIVPSVEFQYNVGEFFSIPVTQKFPKNILFNDNPSTVWLRTNLLISNSTGNFSEFNTHFTSTLYQQYLRDSEFDMVRYVLGAVQAGAVGYMAYRHIKKYGFWK